MRRVQFYFKICVIFIRYHSLADQLECCHDLKELRSVFNSNDQICRGLMVFLPSQLLKKDKSYIDIHLHNGNNKRRFSENNRLQVASKFDTTVHLR